MNGPKVTDIRSRMRQKDSRPPDRQPDFELRGWMKDGQVAWSCLNSNVPCGPNEHPGYIAAIAALDAWHTTAAGQHIPEEHHPLLVTVHYANGTSIQLFNTTIFEGCNWRNGWWWLKRAVRCFAYLARFAWMATRGRYIPKKRGGP